MAPRKAPRPRKGPANKNVEEAKSNSSESGNVVQKPRTAKASKPKEKSKKAPPKKSSKARKHVEDEEEEEDDDSDDDVMHAEALSEEEGEDELEGGKSYDYEI